MQVRLDAFEGPMDLLYHLIEKNEIDIYDIPIASLTEQYLEFLETVEDRDKEYAPSPISAYTQRYSHRNITPSARFTTEGSIAVSSVSRFLFL